MSLQFYTNIHRLTDGFGESLKFIIFSILFVEYHKQEFHYHPFEHTLEHNYDNDSLFLLKKEEMMRFINIFPIVDYKNLEYQRLCKFTLMHFFHVIGKNYIYESPLFKKCKDYFYHGRKRRIEEKYIAVHLRRMNTLDWSRVTDKIIQGCDVPDSIYVELCIILKKKYPDFKIHLFSQGEQNNFSIELQNVVDVWDLNDSVENTFYDMVFADVLVIAPSAFSYTAGLYSNSEDIYYIQSSLTPLPKWKPITGYTSTRDIERFIMKKEEGWVDIIFDPVKNELVEIKKN